MEVYQSFTLNNGEVSRGVYFSHTNEPMITFNPARDLVYVNAVCLKRLTDMDYALFLVFPAAKRLCLCPCGADELNAVRLRSAGKNRCRVRHIRCEEFMHKLIVLMQWNRDCRYRLLGTIAEYNAETAIVFDLTSAEVFKPLDDDSEKLSRAAEYPPEWGGGFGIPFEEYRKNPLIKTFEQDSDITVENEEEQST